MARHPYIDGDIFNLDGLGISSPTITDIYRRIEQGGGGGDRPSNTIRILHVGNSYAVDATSYLKPLFQELLPNSNVIVGLIHNDGASLQRYDEELFPQDYAQYYYKLKDNEWTSKRGYSIKAAFQDEKWDIVIVQQQSTNSKDYSTYQPYLTNNLGIVKSLMNRNHVRGFLLGMPRRSASDPKAESAFNGQASAAKNVLRDTSCEFVIPCGTAIQNLRTIDSFENVGNETWLQSGGHLCTGMGMLTEGYVYVLWVAQLLGLNVSVIDSKFRPTTKDSHAPSRGDIEPQGITEANVRLGQLAATYAMRNPFTITDMTNDV